MNMKEELIDENDVMPEYLMPSLTIQGPILLNENQD
jgi:hypothetical protein